MCLLPWCLPWRRGAAAVCWEEGVRPNTSRLTSAAGHSGETLHHGAVAPPHYSYRLSSHPETHSHYLSLWTCLWTAWTSSTWGERWRGRLKGGGGRGGETGQADSPKSNQHAEIRTRQNHLDQVGTNWSHGMGAEKLSSRRDGLLVLLSRIQIELIWIGFGIGMTVSDH